MKVYLMIINGLGIGPLPDSSKYTKIKTNTLGDVCRDLPLSTLNAIGFMNVYGVLNDEYPNAVSTIARVRMITNRVGYKYGINEILGNVIDYDNEKPITHNMVDMLRDFGYNVLSIGDSSFDVDIPVQKDKEIADFVFNSNNTEYDVLIAVMNGFFNTKCTNSSDRLKRYLVSVDNYCRNVINKMEKNDLFIIVGNQGVDVANKCASREYSPIIVFTKRAPEYKNLGTVQGLDCVAMTILDYLNVYNNDKSLLPQKDLVKSDKKNNVGLLKKAFSPVLKNSKNKILELNTFED